MRIIKVTGIVLAVIIYSAQTALSTGHRFMPVFLHAHKTSGVGNITTKRLLNGDGEPGNWLTGGRDWRQSYYSPLTNINRDNIHKLGFAWSYDIPFDVGFQATPIVVDGVMFTSGNHGNVYALDARTGALRWAFVPKFDPAILRVQCCDGVNRGVAVWHGKVYVAAVDGMLYALNADNGEVVWKMDTIVDHARSYTSTGAPYIAKNVVVIGNSGGEYDTRGYITAYDVETGKFAWRFFTVPGDPKKGFEHPELEMAAKTWDPDTPWDIGLGGTVWDGMAYDPKLNLLYFGTGNGLPWNRKLRGPAAGDHLFVTCLIAVNPDTGRLAWYYQTTPGDDWDYDADQKPVLANLKIIDGKPHEVIMQANKNGFFYVLDRKTGRLLSATPFAYMNWASYVDMKTGRPVETGKADYSKAAKLVFPTQQGAHNWNPMSFNPRTGLVYIPVLEQGEVWGAGEYTHRKGQWNIGASVVDPYPGPLGMDSPIAKDWPSLAELSAGLPDPSPRVFLRAWDPVGQKVVWQFNATEGSNKPAYGTSYGARYESGVMSTATGLVFQGHIDGHLRVFDAATGVLLHSIDVGTSMTAAPMTYSLDGEQYVAIMAGANAKRPAYADYKYGNKGRIVAFKLGGSAVPQRALIENDQGLEPPVNDLAKPEETAAGAKLFAQHCADCHSMAGRAPDLSHMNAQTHREFLAIVLEGSRATKGMGNFSDILTQKEAEAIHAYVIHVSWERYKEELEHESQMTTTPN